MMLLSAPGRSVRCNMSRFVGFGIFLAWLTTFLILDFFTGLVALLLAY